MGIHYQKIGHDSDFFGWTAALAAPEPPAVAERLGWSALSNSQFWNDDFPPDLFRAEVGNNEKLGYLLDINFSTYYIQLALILLTSLPPCLTKIHYKSMLYTEPSH